jgi:hypothetical protein
VTHHPTGETWASEDLDVEAPTCTDFYWRGEYIELDCPLDEDHRVTIQADDHEIETITVFSASNDADGCCACGFDLAEYDVQLEELGEEISGGWIPPGHDSPRARGGRRRSWSHQGITPASRSPRST